VITSNEGTGSEIGMGNGGIKMEFEMCLWIARNFAVKEIRVYSVVKCYITDCRMRIELSLSSYAFR
jgi:hypothetical protein